MSYNRPIRKFYRLQSKSTTAYKNTSREILVQSHFLSDVFLGSRHKIVEIPSFTPAIGGGMKDIIN
ncbi:MAG: hypothetical protein LBR79_05095 [Oscillospiraceae bacterium]|nr:hypothetical protein [Oscillospiraceae bacterium]